MHGELEENLIMLGVWTAWGHLEIGSTGPFRTTSFISSLSLTPRLTSWKPSKEPSPPETLVGLNGLEKNQIIRRTVM